LHLLSKKRQLQKLALFVQIHVDSPRENDSGNTANLFPQLISNYQKLTVCGHAPSAES